MRPSESTTARSSASLLSKRTMIALIGKSGDRVTSLRIDNSEITGRADAGCLVLTGFAVRHIASERQECPNFCCGEADVRTAAFRIDACEGEWPIMAR